ncbi:MAG: DNA polymerase III subunit epsilon [Betaproteobacteria bacterium]
MSRQVVLDTETTGLDPALGHRIIEIACVEMVNRRLTNNNFYKRIHPEREIDSGATAVHGITLADLAHEPKFADIAEEFLRYVNGAELIIHNAPFDVGFLNAELRRINVPPVTSNCTIVDTLAMARDLHPGKRNNLDALCDRYDVDNSARAVHGALLDAELLSDVYIAMTRGQDSLAIGLEIEAGPEKIGQAMTPRPAVLKVIHAEQEETKLHAVLLAEVKKASGSSTVWFDAAT